MKKKRLPVVFLLAAVAAVGIYAGMRYRREVYLPEQAMQADEAQLHMLIEEIRPELPETVQTAEQDLLAEARSGCADVVAWIQIPDTQIDYPVVQAEDNAFYLNHGPDRAENRLGTPFLDCRCLPDFSGFTSIVYGHHSTKKRMFTQICDFRNPQFFAQHRTGRLILGAEVRTVRFFAYLNVKSNAPVYHTVFLTEDEKKDYLAMLLSEALYKEDVQPETLADSHLLLLSTCSYEFDNARGVLAGVIGEPEVPQQ